MEMIISMLIISAIVLMIYTSYSMVVRTWKKNHAQSAEFRLEIVGDRLLHEDWRNIVPYTYGTERGAYSFLYGKEDRLSYVTTHRLGARRRIGGGLFFTLLLIAPAEEGMSLYCYKTDIPEPDLMQLVRLYQSGDNDPQIARLEAALLENAVLLKSVDEAMFSFDTKSANETATNATDEEADDELSLLSMDAWHAADMPKRIRISLRRGEVLTWLESEPVRASEADNATDDEASIPVVDDVPDPDLLDLQP